MSTRCPIDGNEFPDKESLGAHITQYHPQVAGVPSFAPPPMAKGAGTVSKIKEDLTHGTREEPAGKPISAVEKAELDKQTAELQARLGATPTPAPVKKEPTPIKLCYNYEGTCPNCLKEVTTLSFDVEDRLFVCAYCDSCRKQIKSQKVIPINEQLPVTPKQNEPSLRNAKTHKLPTEVR